MYHVRSHACFDLVAVRVVELQLSLFIVDRVSMMPRWRRPWAGPADHRPKKQRWGLSAEEGQLYDLFYAILAGCGACVRLLLHNQGASALSASRTQGYTAIDFAEWAENNAQGDRRICYSEITAMVRECAGQVAQPHVGGALLAPGQPQGASGEGLPGQGCPTQRPRPSTAPTPSSCLLESGDELWGSTGEGDHVTMEDKAS